MIKFVAAAGSGEPLVGIGLSDENLRRLRAGQPIRVRLGDLLPGVNIEVLIFAGATEYDLTEQLAGLIGPETRLRREPPR